MTQTDQFGFPLEDDEVEVQEEQGSTQKTGAPKQLRDAYKAQTAALKEAQTQLAKFLTDAKNGAVSKVLEAKGVNPKVAKFVLADAGDNEVDEGFVSKWLEDNGELFGVEVKEDPPAIDEATQTAYEQFSEAANGNAAPPTGVQAKMTALKALERLDPRSPEYKKAMDAVFES